MVLTVRGLVSISRLDLTVAAGAAGLDREIRWAHSIELADPTPWLAGGELILTTGWRRSADDPSWAGYIQRLDAAGAAGVAFGVGVGHSEIPSSLISAANERQFPLLCIPLPVPFIAVIKAVSDKLAEERLAEERETIDHQSKIIRAASEKGVPGIVTHLARLVQGEVAVVDRDLVRVAADPPNAIALTARITQEIRRRDRWRGSASISEPDNQLTIQSIATGDGPPGYIGVSTSAALKPLQHLLLSQACALIALEWQQPRAVRERDNGLRACLLELGLTGALASGDLRRHARFFGFFDGDQADAEQISGEQFSGEQSSGERTGDPQVSGSQASGELTGDPQVSDQAKGDHARGDHIVAFSIASSMSPADMLTHVQGALDIRGVPHLCLATSDEVLILTTKGRWRQAAEELLTRLKVAQATGVTIGIGAPQPWSALARTVQQARHARRAGRAGNRERVEFASLGPFGVLLATHTPETLTELSDSVLKALDDYEGQQTAHPRGAGNLVETIRVFLEHNGHWESAASSLGIHRHSLRYRIRRIEELTGRSLDSSADRSEFLIAITAREFVRNDAGGPRPTDGAAPPLPKQ